MLSLRQGLTKLVEPLAMGKCTWAPSSVSRARKRSFQGWDFWDSRVRPRCFALVLNPKSVARDPDNIADDPIVSPAKNFRIKRVAVKLPDPMLETLVCLYVSPADRDKIKSRRADSNR